MNADGNRKCAKCGHSYDDHEFFNALACSTYDMAEEPCKCDGFEESEG